MNATELALDPARLKREAMTFANDAFTQIEALVRQSSATFDVRGVNEVLAAWRAMLPAATRWRRIPASEPAAGSDAVATMRGTGSARLLLVGHADTVPVGRALAECVVRDGRAFGRGTHDMKGGLVAMAGLMHFLAGHPQAFAEVTALVVVDEERRTKPFARSDLGEDVDGCLGFEGPPTGDRPALVTARYGAGVLASTILGRDGRAARPLAGPNPAVGVAELTRWFEARGEELYPDLHVVPVHIHMDTPVNVIAREARLDTIVRYCDEASRLDAGIPHDLPREAGKCDVTHDWRDIFPALTPSARTSEVVERSGVLLGVLPDELSRTGSADVSWFGREVPVVVDGLGPRGDGDHGPDEYLDVSSIAQQGHLAIAVSVAILERCERDGALR